MRSWHSVKTEIRLGFTEEQHQRAARALRDARVRYEVLKTQYIRYSEAELQKVVYGMGMWWQELTPAEKRQYVVWFRWEARRIRLDIAEHKRPGTKQRIKRSRVLYGRRNR